MHRHTFSWVLAAPSLLLCVACGGSSAPTRPTPLPPIIVPVDPPPPAPPPPEPPPPLPPPPPPPPPTLAATRFLAFGDSLTQGTISLGPPMFMLVAPPTSAAYPAKLQSLLAARYTAQQVTVINEGLPGEYASEGAKRFPSVVRAQQPQVVLLMEGDNDLDLLGSRGIRVAATAIEDMAKEARFRGARVFIATLPPQREGGLRAQSANLVPAYNNEIKTVARGEGARVVDLYAAFDNDVSLIGSDGLHPTEAGYDRIAQTFFEAVKAEFERPPAPSPNPPPAPLSEVSAP